MNAFAVVFALGALAYASAGVISTANGYLAPGVVASPYAVPYLANPYIASPYAAVLPAGHGLEGQYVHDHTERLYDDGSYKPEARALPLAASPYGLVPAGSGLEDQKPVLFP
ncbi:hypothetical protein JTB14_034028 [Gonioctena quinquepunctata]|nr:hypothetical protein JTB14_034028 [Gonioctena quinquepunctata]